MYDDKMPVFLINGFLEAGKTQFLQFTMAQQYFMTEGKTLLIVCEEGDTEYDQDLLKKTHTQGVFIEDFEELTPQKLKELERIYKPERVLIEWNGMWNQDALVLPDDWFLYQQISIIDTSTLDLYLKNMKPLLASMIKKSEMILCNRCDDIDSEVLGNYRLALKALNQTGELIFENASGDIQNVAIEDLPYDMSAPVVQISPEDYGIWYVDCMDRTDEYAGKVFEFSAMVLRAPDFPPCTFVPGRMAMTCCEADMSFLGFVCKYDNADSLSNKQWVKVQARMENEYNEGYGEKGPVLYALKVEKADPIKDIVQF